VTAPTAGAGNDPRRVLVTGASGFIGAHTLAPLVARGYDVHAVYSKRQPIAVPGVSYLRADLLDFAAIRAAVEQVRPGSLLHLAWYVEPGKMITHPDNLRWVQASLELLRVFREQGGARCAISGSCYEYDWRYGYCSETLTPRAPDTLYGAAKHSLQQAFAGYCAMSGLSGVWGRAFFIYGPHENPSRLVSSVVRSLLKGEPAKSSHGLQIRDYTYVQDVADGYVALLDSQATGAYNVASGRAHTLRAIIERIGHLLNRSELLRIGALPARANDTPLVVGDIGQIQRDIGWTPKIDLDEGLTATIDWWRTRMQDTGELPT
jgi:nucleoside-diphosphate-sugar epimerase